MLNNCLFKINTIEASPQAADNTTVKQYMVVISLDSKHDIFNGHFPGNPILPGVCQVEIVREVAETICGSKLMLVQASLVKYLSLINPVSEPVLQLQLKFNHAAADELDVLAEIRSGEKVFMKMKGRLKESKN